MTLQTTPATGPTVETDPAELGFDPARLARIDEHFGHYVDDGRLAGWTVAVARHDRLVHLSHHGDRDIDTRAPVTDDTIWRIYSMTKPITSIATRPERRYSSSVKPVKRSSRIVCQGRAVAVTRYAAVGREGGACLPPKQ